MIFHQALINFMGTNFKLKPTQNAENAKTGTTRFVGLGRCCIMLQTP